MRAVMNRLDDTCGQVLLRLIIYAWRRDTSKNLVTEDIFTNVQFLVQVLTSLIKITDTLVIDPYVVVVR